MPGPLLINYDPSVTPQMKAWIEDFQRKCRFPLDRIGITANISVVSEPSAVGHNDYMSTTTDGSPTAVVEIREGVDQLDADVNAVFQTASELQAFFVECLTHEIVGHAFTNVYLATDDDRKTTIAGWFRRDILGDRRQGALDDWTADPADLPWVDRVVEAMAEFMKDVYLPEQYRFFEQRTNWTFIETSFGDFVELIESIICPGA